MNNWTKLVKEKFALGRSGNKAYTLGDAMKAAKKVYKKGSASIKSTVSRMSRRRKSKKSKTMKRRR